MPAAPETFWSLSGGRWTRLRAPDAPTLCGGHAAIARAHGEPAQRSAAFTTKESSSSSRSVAMI
jgi:hypothetical protein